MDPPTRYTVQERIKIVEAYFATKSVVLTQRQFRRDFPRKNPPSRLTIRRLLEKFRETGSVGDTNKGDSGRPRSSRTDTTFGGITTEINEAFVTGGRSLKDNCETDNAPRSQSVSLQNSDVTRLQQIRNRDETFVLTSVSALKTSLICWT